MGSSREVLLGIAGPGRCWLWVPGYMDTRQEQWWAGRGAGFMEDFRTLGGDQVLTRLSLCEPLRRALVAPGTGSCSDPGNVFSCS